MVVANFSLYKSASSIVCVCVCVTVHINHCSVIIMPVINALIRSGSSGGSPLKSDEIAEVEEYFHRRDMKGSRRLWGQNNCMFAYNIFNHVFYF